MSLSSQGALFERYRPVVPLMVCIGLAATPTLADDAVDVGEDDGLCSERQLILPSSGLCAGVSGEAKFEVIFEDNEPGKVEATGELGFEIGKETDHGDFLGVVAVELTFEPEETTFELAEGYLQLGALMAGYAETAFAYDGGFTFSGSLDDDKEVLLASLELEGDSHGLVVSVEHPYLRWGEATPSSVSIPDIVGVLWHEGDFWDTQLSVGFAQVEGGSAWAAQAGATFDVAGHAHDDQLRVKFALGRSPTDVGNAFLGCEGGGLCAYALASYLHHWTAHWSSAATFAYNSHGNEDDACQASANLVWSGEQVLRVGVEGAYGCDGVVSGRLRLSATIE